MGGLSNRYVGACTAFHECVVNETSTIRNANRKRLSIIFYCDFFFFPCLFSRLPWSGPTFHTTIAFSHAIHHPPPPHAPHFPPRAHTLGASLALSEDAKTREWERNGESCRVSTTADFKLMGSTKGFTAYTADGATSHPDTYCGNGQPDGHAATEYVGNDDAAGCAAKCKAVNCTCYDFLGGKVSC